MKSSVLKYSIGITLFLILLAVSVALIKPLYTKIIDRYKTFEGQYLELLADKTGLGVRYRSVSPSLLNGISLKGVEVYDLESGEVVLKVKKIFVDYDLKRLINLDIENAFKKVTLSDVSFEYNMDTNEVITKKIMDLLAENKNDSQFELNDENIEKIKDMLFMVPVEVQVRNIKAHLVSGGNDLSLVLKTVNFVKDESSSCVAANVNGSVYAVLEALDGQSAGTNFSMNARIFREISDSSIFLTMNKHAKADYSVSNLEFMVRYASGDVYVTSVQQLSPYSINLKYNLEGQNVTAKVLTQDFDPFETVIMPPMPSISSVKGSRFTLNADVEYGLGSNDLKWSGYGSVSLARQLLGCSELLSFDAKGHNYNVVLNTVKLRGALVGLSANGTLNLNTMAADVYADLEHYTLDNGNSVNFEAFVTGSNYKYSAFVPQVFLGDKFFTALQGEFELKGNDVLFKANVSDYAHPEYDVPGEIEIDGSYELGNGGRVEAILDANNVFVDSLVEAGAFLVQEELAQQLYSYSAMVSPFIMGTELYFSTDFKNITYNSPYSVLANTEAARQALVVSFDGTDQIVNVSQLDLVYDDINIQGTVQAQMSLEDNQIIFGTDFNLNSLPYHVAGSLTNGTILNVTGNYGLDIMVNLGRQMSGSVQFLNLPINYQKMDFSTSLSADFTYDLDAPSLMENAFTLDIKNLEASVGEKTLAFRPRISLSAFVDQSGVQITYMDYSDTSSSLTGSGYAMWNLNQTSFENMNVNLMLSNEIGAERIRVAGTVTNILGSQGLTVENIMDYSIDFQGAVENIAMSRFAVGQTKDDIITAGLNATGTIRNPSLNARLDKFYMTMGGSQMKVKGSVGLEMIDEDEWNTTLTSLNLYWREFSLLNFNGNLELKSFMGKIQGNINADLGEREATLPLTVTISNLSGSGKELIPTSYKVNLDCDKINGNLFREKIPVHAEIVRYPGTWTVTTDEFFGLSGYFTDQGRVALNIKEKKPFHFNLSGTVNLLKNTMDLKLQNIYMDASRFADIINSNQFSLYTGVISGNINLSGVLTDPNLDGSVNIAALDFNLPDYIPDHFTCRSTEISISHDDIILPQTLFNIKDTSLEVMGSIILDRWSLDSLSIKAKTVGKKGIPVDAKIPFVHASGRVSIDVDMNMVDTDIDVTGDVKLENSEITILDFSTIGNNKSDKKENGESDKASEKTAEKNANDGKLLPFDIKADVKVLFGQKVQFIINPIVRALVAPDANVELSMNTESDLWNIKGDVVLRGGEVSYLNRNFYLKEGRIIMNENQDNFDPMVTLRAETREHDEAGVALTITLSAIRQKVSQFSPQLYSTPAKSQNELYQILGQVAVADSENATDLILAGLDYGVQVTVLRSLENALRDLFNFDIFSIRSSVLQNAVKQGLNMNSSDNTAMNIGNYLDNSTVYIGKYIGNSIYLDAMMHLTYDETQMEAKSSSTGLVFKPEIGMEFSSPFATIRWDFAPDLGALQSSLVPANSLTLSWRFTF